MARPSPSDELESVSGTRTTECPAGIKCSHTCFASSGERQTVVLEGHPGPRLLVRLAVGARDLIIDSVPILAWRRRDPDAAFGHAPTHHPLPLLRGFRVHTLICPCFGLASLVSAFSCQFTRCSFHTTLVGMGPAALPDPSPYCPLRCCLLGPAPHHLDSCCSWSCGCHRVESQKPEKPVLLASHLDQGRTWQTKRHRALLWTRASLFSPPTPSLMWLV